MVSSFCGRKHELEQLKFIWAKAKKGKPQVVNYIADTGVGKTRLAQAFYEWLSTDPEQGGGKSEPGYWPTDLGGGRQRAVNPELKRFGAFDLKNRAIPWLWWGMYWTEAPKDVLNALAAAGDYLDFHLHLLELNHCRDQAALSTARDVIVEAAVGAVGGGTVFSIGKLVKQLADNSRLSQEAQKGVAYLQAQRFQDQSEKLLDRLTKQYKKAAGRTPMVLFLDDIHFATDISQDEITLSFLERLLRLAAMHHWPLLVLSTHWKEPWLKHQSIKALQEARPWRKIVDLLMDEVQFKGKIDVHNLDLTGLENTEMRKVALSHLPGLSDANLDAILNNVDNVRWLVEILKTLSDHCENFLEQSRERALSPSGIKRLDKLLSAEGGYLGVIRQRLAGDNMQDMRHVLGAAAWHTYGLEFVGPLAVAFEARLLEQRLIGTQEGATGVVTALLQAMNPAALLEGSSETGELGELLRFPERGYLVVAREALDDMQAMDLSVVLGQRIIEWMQPSDEATPKWQQLKEHRARHVFLGMAVEVLGKLQPRLTPDQEQKIADHEILLRKQVEKGRMTEADCKLELQEEKDKLLSENSSRVLANAAKFHAYALAELIPIISVDSHSQAWKRAEQFANHPAFAEACKMLRPDTIPSITHIYLNSKSHFDAIKILCTSSLDAHKNDHHESLTSFLIRANCLRILGDSELEKLNFKQSHSHYTECLEVIDRVIKFMETQPVAFSNQADTFTHHIQLVRFKIALLFQLLDTSNMLDSHGEVLLYFMHITDSLNNFINYHSTSPEIYLLEINTFKQMAKSYEKYGQLEASTHCYKKCLTLCDDLISSYGETPDYITESSSIHVNFGNSYFKLGEIEKAREQYELSLMRLNKIDRDDLSTFNNGLKLFSEAYFNIGQARCVTKDLGGALSAFNSSWTFRLKAMEIERSPLMLLRAVQTLERIIALELELHGYTFSENFDSARNTLKELLDDFPSYKLKEEAIAAYKKIESYFDLY